MIILSAAVKKSFLLYLLLPTSVSDKTNEFELLLSISNAIYSLRKLFTILALPKA